jgi:hypothetical protein
MTGKDRPPGGEPRGPEDTSPAGRGSAVMLTDGAGDHPLVALMGSFRIPADAEADDPTTPDYRQGDLGPRRGPRRRNPTTYGQPSTFGLGREALRSERRRRELEGWGEWEITARFADPDAARPNRECPGQFGPAGRWVPCCRGDAA